MASGRSVWVRWPSQAAVEVAPVESATRWVPAAASSRSLSANTAAVIWATASSISRISRPVSVTAGPAVWTQE